ncbi:MAG: DNA repair protein RecO [Bacteroidetes bacterium]|nr:DNA repair protein RecO [Bacteroidota bacterium]
MSKIIKTEAIVLSKMNYRDTSIITIVYTEELGKISAIVKGGRSPRSKFGMIIDPLNHLQIIIYLKESREVQLLSDAGIISHFPKLKENLKAVKYSYAVIELVNKLIPGDEPNKRIFKGLVRILSLLNSSDQSPEILFGRFFLFLTTEIGYEIQLDKCSVCGSTELNNGELGFNYGRGLLCTKCKKESIDNYKINSELFSYIICLKNNEQVNSLTETTINNANNFFESYLQYHIYKFKEIQSLKTL